MVRRACVLVGLTLALGACGTGGDNQSTGDTRPPATTSGAVAPSPVAGSSPTTAPVPPGTTTRPPTRPPEGPARCVAADLDGTIGNADAGAGSRFAELIVRNTSDAPCTLYGYGGLEFVDASGAATPTDLVRRADPGPSLVTLAPGQTAAKKLRWGVIPRAPEPAEGPCQTASAGIRVIPPDDTTAFLVPYDFGSVCSGGRVEGSAYYVR